ncbi:ATP-binding cassette domain-containing protein, partial [Streptomyces hebeiensis]|uniref:ATP-binding cassette domain-containing protein n=1 Tax=Streptomyces hebeiensis TaxID=229486 RepID=UPI0031D011E6
MSRGGPVGDPNSEGNGGNDASDAPAGTDAPDCDGGRGDGGRHGHPGDGDPAPAAAAGLTGTAAGLTAEDLGVKGPRGWVFRHLRFEAAPGALVAVEGDPGSGRTCLLLTLTGRMRPTEGRARVGGAVLPRAMGSVRRFSALGPVPGVNDLDPALTVAEHLRERELLRSRSPGPPPPPPPPPPGGGGGARRGG